MYIFYHIVIKYLNFYELIFARQTMQQIAMGIIFSYFACYILLAVIAEMNPDTERGKLFTKIVNWQYLLTVRVLSGPILAFCVNQLYCTQSTPFHFDIKCYSPIHITFCVISGILLFILLFEIVCYVSFYYIKNPLSCSYLGQQNQYYMISKSVIKLLLPVYFLVDLELAYSMVYTWALVGVWGIYIFWHRLMSIHTHKQSHFYVEYFMEVILFWVALNNIVSIYLKQTSTESEYSFLYVFISGVFVAMLMIYI